MHDVIRYLSIFSRSRVKLNATTANGQATRALSADLTLELPQRHLSLPGKGTFIPQLRQYEVEPSSPCNLRSSHCNGRATSSNCSARPAVGCSDLIYSRSWN